MKQKDVGIGRRPEILRQPRLDIDMTDDLGEPIRTPGFAPHWGSLVGPSKMIAGLKTIGDGGAETRASNLF
jgi:hypothetical protein